MVCCRGTRTETQARGGEGGRCHTGGLRPRIAGGFRYLALKSDAVPDAVRVFARGRASGIFRISLLTNGVVFAMIVKLTCQHVPM